MVTPSQNARFPLLMASSNRVVGRPAQLIVFASIISKKSTPTMLGLENIIFIFLSKNMHNTQTSIALSSDEVEASKTGNIRLAVQHFCVQYIDRYF